jgi:hypothetical protein
VRSPARAVGGAERKAARRREGGARVARKGRGFMMLGRGARRTGAGARVARSRRLRVESWRLETESYGGRNKGFSWECFKKMC